MSLVHDLTRPFRLHPRASAGAPVAPARPVASSHPDVLFGEWGNPSLRPRDGQRAVRAAAAPR